MANEIQTLSFSPTPTGGSFTISFPANGGMTGDILWNYDLTDLQSQVNSALGSGNCTVSGSISGGLTFTYGGAYSGTNVGQLTCDASGLTGPLGDPVISDTTGGGQVGVAGSGLQCNGVVASADDSSLSDGSEPFTLSFTYTPSAADIAGTNPPGFDSYMICWGNYSPTLFAVGIAGNQWLVTDASSQFPRTGPINDTLPHNIVVAYDGSGNVTFTDNGGTPVVVTLTFSITLAGAAGLLFGGLPGNVRIATGVLSNVSFLDGSGNPQFAWPLTSNGDETVDSNPATVTGSFVDGQPEIQILTLPTLTGASGGFNLESETLTVGQSTTGTITAADVQAACDASDIGSGTVVVTGSDGGPFTITWQGDGSQSLLTIDTNTMIMPVAATPDTTQNGGGPFIPAWAQGSNIFLGV